MGEGGGGVYVWVVRGGGGGDQTIQESMRLVLLVRAFQVWFLSVGKEGGGSSVLVFRLGPCCLSVAFVK
jgi:hypothetical protein